MQRLDYLDMLGSNLGSDRQQGQGGQGRGVMGPGGAIEPKRVTQDNGPNPLRRGWNGWQEQPDQMEGGPFGGAGGPMPIPDGGPNWRGTTGGFDPVGSGGGMGSFQPTDIPNGSGAGGPMPIPWPAGSSPVPGNPNAYYMQNHPNNPNSKYAQWKASQQQTPAPPPPGNAGIVPPHMGDGNNNGGPRILGGPYGPPHPQGGPQVPQAADTTPAPMAPRPFQPMRQMRQFQPNGGMNGGRMPQWQNAMGNSPQGRMDFLNKLKQSYNGGQGFKWNF